MLKWMSHPEHGVIDVYDDATIAHNEKFGWSVVEPEQTADTDIATGHEDELSALRDQAEEMGIAVDGRWGISRLKKELEADA